MVAGTTRWSRPSSVSRRTLAEEEKDRTLKSCIACPKKWSWSPRPGGEPYKKRPGLVPGPGPRVFGYFFRGVGLPLVEEARPLFFGAAPGVGVSASNSPRAAALASADSTCSRREVT